MKPLIFIKDSEEGHHDCLVMKKIIKEVNDTMAREFSKYRMVKDIRVKVDVPEVGTGSIKIMFKAK